MKISKMRYKSTKSTFCNTSTRRSFSYPSDPSYPSYLLRVAVAHKVANQLAQVHSQLTHMRHYDDRNGSKTRVAASAHYGFQVGVTMRISCGQERATSQRNRS
jgi:hypothetical protein